MSKLAIGIASIALGIVAYDKVIPNQEAITVEEPKPAVVKEGEPVDPLPDIDNNRIAINKALLQANMQLEHGARKRGYDIRLSMIDVNPDGDIVTRGESPGVLNYRVKVKVNRPMNLTLSQEYFLDDAFQSPTCLLVFRVRDGIVEGVEWR